jgi:[ribosomal protein S5]-alanine N-acetyltransferase
MIQKKIWVLFLGLISFALSAQEICQSMTIPILQTDRLTLRLIDMQDAQALFEITSDENITEYTYMITLHASIDDTEKWIERILNQYEKDGVIPFVVVDTHTHEILGCCFAWYLAKHARMDVGYFYKKSSWGKGFATEALQALIQFLCTSTNCVRIEATCDPKNKASAKVLEKAGMIYEGLLRNFVCVRNLPEDRKIYAFIPESYKKSELL